jgi:cyanuric acid amidohydrolase
MIYFYTNFISLVDDPFGMAAINVFRVATSAPDDTNGLESLIDDGTVDAEDIICILGKTEGNGCVNDFSRGLATLAYKTVLSERLDISRDEVGERVALIMSGGTEGVMSPHITVFAQRDRETTTTTTDEKRLTAGTAFTKEFRPEEIGRMEQVRETADAVATAMDDAGIEDEDDVHFVQIKCPLLTSDRIEDAHERDEDVVVEQTYKSMGYSRGASALGVGLTLNEVSESALSDEIILQDDSIYSEVASTSAGVELNKSEIILLGNSSDSESDHIIGHDVMDDALDAEAVRNAIEATGLDPNSENAREKVVNVFSKAEASSDGRIRDRRHVILNDSDIEATRHIRAVVNAVVGSVIGDSMQYVSGGAEHQGPDGGGPVAAISRTD